MHSSMLKQRGFTLIELAVVVLLGSVLSSSIFGIMYMQNLSFLERMDEVDAHQNGRATVNLIRRYVHSARWGMAQNSNAAGDVPIGVCYNTSLPTSTQTNCNNLATDNGADRLRVLFINDDTEYVGNANWIQAGPCTTGTADVTKVAVGQNPVTPFTSGPLGLTLGALGGNCVASTPPAGTDLIYITADAGAGNGCLHRYTYSLVSGATALSCGSSGYASDFSFGRATVADFYIYNDSQLRPQLMLRTDPRTAIASASIVGFDIEDLQLRYGIDLGTPPHRAVDIWCDDPRIASDGGSCTTTDSAGNTLTSTNNRNRIVAVQATVRVRTDSTRPNIYPMPLNPNWTVANPVANLKDGYQRWLYTTTVMLRNNVLNQ